MLVHCFRGSGGERLLTMEMRTASRKMGETTNQKAHGFLRDVLEHSCPASSGRLTLFGVLFVTEQSSP